MNYCTADDTGDLNEARQVRALVMNYVAKFREIQ